MDKDLSNWLDDVLAKKYFLSFLDLGVELVERGDMRPKIAIQGILHAGATIQHLVAALEQIAECPEQSAEFLVSIAEEALALTAGEVD